MPSSVVKKLYLAKSWNDLESKAGEKLDTTIRRKSTSLLVSSASKVFQSAEKSFLEKDEEKAYQLYARYVELVLILKTRNDFKTNPDSKKLSLNANTAISKAEMLKVSLMKRYSILEEANCLAQNEKNDMITAYQNSKMAEQVTAEVEATKKEEKDVPEYSISSVKLFSILFNPQSSFILMDTRPENDFAESHIKHSHCINVPQDILLPGTTAVKLESLLNQDSLGKWYKRGNVDYVVLIDWDSKDESSKSRHLETLTQAMSKWDQKCELKRPPMILQGGYKDWMSKYPMYTTQALNFDSMKSPAISPDIADLSGVEYPNFDEPDATTTKENLNGPGTLFVKTNHIPEIPDNLTKSNSSGIRSSKSAPAIDRKSKPLLNNRTAKTSVGERKAPDATSNHTLKEVRSLPTVSKPIESPLAASQGEKDQQLVNSLNKESSLVKESVQLIREQIAKEQEFEKLRLKKTLEAEESIRAEIQKREEQLSEHLKKLQLDNQEKDKCLLKVKEENMKMKQQLEENSKREEEREFQKQKEKEILEAEKEKRALLEYVEKLREDRKKQELAKRKELTKSESAPREVVSANTGLKRSPHTQSTSQSSDYTIPLSRESSTDSSSRGMVRSHSSPNIAQMVNQEENALNQRKTPIIDRALKPKTKIPQSHQNSSARIRSLNGVYGNVPIPPATGLRNLGNTCFMNSIIQCLSNTLPLAEYFNYSEYVDDLNRDNKTGAGGEVAEEFAVVIKSLWMAQYKYFSPKDFKSTVSRCLAVCIGNEQQDSHEFFIVLMEKLHAELKRYVNKSVPKLESCNDESTFWMHHKTYNGSKMSDIFEGLLKSTLMCMSCRTTSDSYEVFSCLSLPIMPSRCSLRDCFRNFLKPEKISGEAAWDCPKCKQKKEAEKRLRFSQVPDILVIQLKRFSYEGLWRRKLQSPVDFEFQFEVPFEKHAEQYTRRYNLYAVVNHFGTLEGGHYTAYCCAKNKKWYKYDDHEVSEISSCDIKTPAAYMLFYKSTELHSSL